MARSKAISSRIQTIGRSAEPHNVAPSAAAGEAQHPLGDDTWLGTYASAQQPADLVRFHLGDMSPSALASLARVWDYTPLRPADLERDREAGR